MQSQSNYKSVLQIFQYTVCFFGVVSLFVTAPEFIYQNSNFLTLNDLLNSNSLFKIGFFIFFGACIFLCMLAMKFNRLENYKFWLLSTCGTFFVSLSLLIFYNSYLSSFSAYPLSSKRYVIIGKTLSPKIIPLIADNPKIPIDSLVNSMGGKVDLIWTDIKTIQYQLIGIYFVTTIFILAFVISLIQILKIQKYHEEIHF